MTTRSRNTLPARSARSLHGPKLPVRPRTLATLALLIAIASLASSSLRSGVVQAARLVAPASLSGARAAPADDPRNIDALAGVLAKRYRVSDAATREFVSVAYREGRRHQLDPMLIVAVIAVESSFNPVAQSDAGAMGLMQIVPRYHADKLGDGGEASVLNARTNISLGTRVLKEYIRRGGNENAGLQMYNGSLGDPTMAYATKVMDERDRLRRALRAAASRA